jgi:hypothetical protein
VHFSHPSPPSLASAPHGHLRPARHPLLWVLTAITSLRLAYVLLSRQDAVRRTPALRVLSVLGEPAFVFPSGPSQFIRVGLGRPGYLRLFPSATSSDAGFCSVPARCFIGLHGPVRSSPPAPCPRGKFLARPALYRVRRGPGAFVIPGPRPRNGGVAPAGRGVCNCLGAGPRPGPSAQGTGRSLTSLIDPGTLFTGQRTACQIRRPERGLR